MTRSTAVVVGKLASLKKLVQVVLVYPLVLMGRLLAVAPVLIQTVAPVIVALVAMLVPPESLV